MAWGLGTRQPTNFHSFEQCGQLVIWKSGKFAYLAITVYYSGAKETLPRVVF